MKEQKAERWRGVIAIESVSKRSESIHVESVEFNMDSLDEVKPWMDENLPSLDTSHMRMEGTHLKYDYSTGNDGPGIMRLKIYANYSEDCHEDDWCPVMEIGTLYCID